MSLTDEECADWCRWAVQWQTRPDPFEGRTSGHFAQDCELTAPCFSGATLTTDDVSIPTTGRTPRRESHVSVSASQETPLPNGPARADAELAAAGIGAEAVNDYFRALVQTLPDATIVLDNRFSIRDQTPSATRLLGGDVKTHNGKSILGLAHPDDHAGASAYLSHVLSRPGTGAAAEWRFRHVDGHSLHL